MTGKVKQKEIEMAYATNPNVPAQVAPVKASAPWTFKPYVKPEFAYKHLPMLTDMDVPSTTLMQTLHRMVRTRRAGDSMAEARCVAWLANRLPVTMIDAAGNLHVDMRQGPQHRTMFTCHTDTVHRQGGPNNIRLDTSNPLSVKWRADEGHCLGADDGAGIALIMHMIDHGVPGYYMFFRGEESGGVGSQWLAKYMPHALKDVDRCISFDRADYADVITHQAGGRCCSDEFADALAQALTADDLSLVYMPDSTGVFTDSANLTDIIPECTNLSVGYKHQHGDGEWQDVTFLQALASALVNVRWDDLPVRREPGEDDVTTVKLTGNDLHDDVATALEDACCGGDFVALRLLLGEWIAIDLVGIGGDATAIGNKLPLGKISCARYGHMLDKLNAGWMSPESVLDDLRDILCNV
jgi:hypothetical protein